MSKYDKDPRVRKRGRGYTVTRDRTEVQVLPTKTFGWSIFAGPNLDMAQDSQGNLGYGYSDADAAINAVIGRPRR
jgi:hypothetical protein